MRKRNTLSKEVKDQIIDRIKNQGVSVSEAAQEHGVATNTIYGWLSKKVEGNPSIIEVVKLRKENQALKELVGDITLQLSKSQKKI
ncbi:MAG: transposase [Patescibacteria group bacterium]